MLLLGYQPRDVEISGEVLVGVPAGYAGEAPDGHIHIPTLRAFTELMEHHGFASVQLSRGRPIMRPIHPALRFVDLVLTRRVSLARRFYTSAPNNGSGRRRRSCSALAEPVLKDDRAARGGHVRQPTGGAGDTLVTANRGTRPASSANSLAARATPSSTANLGTRPSR